MNERMTPDERRKALANTLVVLWTLATLATILYLYTAPR